MSAAAAPSAVASPASSDDLLSQVSESHLQRIRDSVIAYTAVHGISSQDQQGTGGTGMYRVASSNGGITLRQSMVASQSSPAAAPLLVHAPLTLLPTPLDRASFERVADLSPLWNSLVDRVSRDEEWLISTLELPARADPWLRRLLDILIGLRREGAAMTQPLRLGVYRSDYMIHVEENDASAGSDASSSLVHTPLQVELNTISASFMGLSTRISSLHRFVLARELGLTEEQLDRRLPVNDAMGNIVQGMATAFNLYKQQHPAPNLCVLMVVQAGDSNAVDQRILEYTLWNNHSVPLIRRTLSEIASTSSSDSAGQLLLDGGAHTVALVYFRAGYTPRDYPSDLEYDAIRIVEKSRAIKCPALAVHLAGCKKVQQVLAAPGVLERFASAEECTRLRECFAGLYALEEDDESTRSVIASALSSPASYVLKPQREGGGNNLWGQDMVDALTRMSKEERAAFILMKKIEPRPTPAALLRKGELLVADALSELGIYSVFVGDGTTTHHSTLCGHLLRTKAVGVDEGGVAAGFSCLSSVMFQ